VEPLRSIYGGGAAVTGGVAPPRLPLPAATAVDSCTCRFLAREVALGRARAVLPPVARVQDASVVLVTWVTACPRSVPRRAAAVPARRVPVIGAARRRRDLVQAQPVALDRQVEPVCKPAHLAKAQPVVLDRQVEQVCKQFTHNLTRL